MIYVHYSIVIRTEQTFVRFMLTQNIRSVKVITQTNVLGDVDNDESEIK